MSKEVHTHRVATPSARRRGAPVAFDITESEWIAQVAHAYYKLTRKPCRSCQYSDEDRAIYRACCAMLPRRR